MIMLCENCKQNEATVYVSEVVNGQMAEHYLCDECVKQGQKDMGTQAILFNNFISELMKIALEEGYIKTPKTPIQKRCPRCDLSLKEFLEIGRFGCKECFTTFNDELQNALTNVHGNTQHVGKMLAAKRADSTMSTLQRVSPIEHTESQDERLERLQHALQKAIKEEAYEEAARLRDTIRAIKKEGE
jgi:protein arginine kinase activator